MSVYSDLLVSYGPSLYWPLSSGSGGTDLSGNGRNATANGGVTVGGSATSPIPGETNSTTLDGVNDSLTIAGYSPFGTTGLIRSATGWANRASLTNNCTLCNAHQAGSGNGQVRIDSGGGNITWGLDPSLGSITATGVWPGSTQWVHWAVVFDDVIAGTTNRLFINGSTVAGPLGMVGSFSQTGFAVGARNAGASDFFNGQMAHVAVFERALTQTEVSSLYNVATIGTTQPVTAPPPRPTGVVSVQEVPALSARYELWDGTDLATGPDDRSVLDTPTQITFETEIPGGFGPSNVVLPRTDEWEPMAAGLLANQIISDEEGRIVHEGRVVGMPHTGVNEVEIQCEGHVKALDDNHAAAEIFRDRDASKWVGPSVARQAQWRAFGGGVLTEDPEVITDNPDTLGIPVVRTKVTGPWGGIIICEANFDTGPCRIGYLGYYWSRSAEISAADTNWAWSVALGDSEQGGAADQSATLRATGPGSGYFTATTTTRRNVKLYLQYGIASGADGMVFSINWQPAVYGDHKLPLKGSEPDAGFLVSDMVPYTVNKWAPSLRTTPDSIEKTSFTVPHASFTEPDQTARSLIEALVVFGGNANFPLDYGCYDNRTFFLKSPGNYGRDWRMRRDEGMESSDQGPDASEQWNGALVAYNPGDGSSRTVGPVGSGCDKETNLLTITDPNHTWTRAGIRRWGRVDAQIMGDDGAILVGQLALAEKNKKQWRGSFTAKGMVKEVGTQVGTPCYMIRAGDQGVVEDVEDTRERRIIHTSYDSRERATGCDVGSTPDRFDTIMAKAGIAISELGL